MFILIFGHFQDAPFWEGPCSLILGRKNFLTDICNTGNGLESTKRFQGIRLDNDNFCYTRVILFYELKCSNLCARSSLLNGLDEWQILSMTLFFLKSEQNLFSVLTLSLDRV